MRVRRRTKNGMKMGMKMNNYYPEDVSAEKPLKVIDDDDHDHDDDDYDDDDYDDDDYAAAAADDGDDDGDDDDRIDGEEPSRGAMCCS